MARSFIFLAVTLLTSGVPYESIIPVPPPDRPAVYETSEHLPPRHISQYTPILRLAADRAGIPVAVLEAVAWTESKFNESALSAQRKDGSRDMGMFQFNSRYLRAYRKKYGWFDPMDAEQAARVAAEHLAYLKEKYVHWPYAIEKYNAGESGENFGYVMRVYRREK